MQVNREERIAKAKGLAILALIAAVALTIHVWPRAIPSPAPSSDVSLTAPAVAAGMTPAAGADSRKPLKVPRRAVRASTPAPAVTVVALPAATRPGDGVAVVDGLTLLPGSTVELPAAQPAASPSRSGAVTRGARSTGKGLARAFQKTGSALRRAF